MKQVALVCFWFLSVFLLPVKSGLTQGETKSFVKKVFPGPVSISAKGHYGSIFKHTVRFRPEITRNTIAWETSVAYQTVGRQPWEKQWGYPVFGLSFSGAHFRQQVFGMAVGIQPFVAFRVADKKSWQAWYRMGAGLAWVTRQHNWVTNPENNVIGSRINNMTRFGFDFSWKLSSRLHLMLSGDFTHYSNGHYKNPNLGINVPTGSLGIRWFPEGDNWERGGDTIPPLNRKYFFSIKKGVGFLGKAGPGGPVYPVYTGSVYVSRMLGYINNLNFGLNYEYRTGDRDFFVLQEIHVGSSASRHASNGSIFLGDEMIFGKVSIGAQLAVYVFYPERTGAPYYGKLQAEYRFLKPSQKVKRGPFVGVYMKFHNFVADYVEVGAGYSF